MRLPKSDIETGLMYLLEVQVERSEQLMPPEDTEYGFDRPADATLDEELLQDFQRMVDASGQTDYWRYLLRVENNMSREERANNNMLLQGDRVLALSCERSLVHLHLERQIRDETAILLFKDLPVMRQGRQLDREMYILGYDLARPGFILRAFERLPPTMALMPDFWDSGIEVIRMTGREVVTVLEGGVDSGAVTLQEALLPRWKDELGMKVVVLVLFGQWILDFKKAFMWERSMERLEELVLKWRDFLSESWSEETGHKHDLAKVEDEQPLLEEEIDTRGAQEVKVLDVVMDSPVLTQSPAAAILACGPDHGSPSTMPPSIKVPRLRKRIVYDSDEEEEWAALQEWAARQKPEPHNEVASTDLTAEELSSGLELSHNDTVDPTDAFLAPEPVESPMEVFDIEKPVDAKRFSDLSTLCDGCEGNNAKLTFANTLSNAMLNEGSIEAMTNAYLDFARRNPEHDSEAKRDALFKFLLSHVDETVGGLLSVERTMKQLQEMGVKEEEVDAKVNRDLSSNALGKRVSWRCLDCLATPLEHNV